nr:hypothetical protein [Tanacetum cinerariifolium]
MYFGYVLSHFSPFFLENAKDTARQEQEKYDLEKALELQKQLDEREEDVAKVNQANDIDWSDPVVLRYHALQNRSFSRAKVKKNMCIYLKNQEGYKQSHFKEMSYEDIRPIYERVWDQNHAFVPKGFEIEKEVMNSKKFRGRLKRRTLKTRNDKDKRQKKQDDPEKLTLMKYVEVIFDLEEVISVIPLDVKSPIVSWESYCKGDVGYYEIHIANRSYKPYIFFSEMLNDFDREDLIVLYILFNENMEKSSQSKLIEWKLYDSCGVHFLMLGEVSIHMLVEKKYPLPQDTLTRMLKWKFHVNYNVTEMAYELLRMEEEGKGYFSPCYVVRLHTYDGEINLKYEKNLISNKVAVKLCSKYEEKNREKLVKRELWFMRLTKGITNFGNGIITIHPRIDPFLDNYEETKKFEDDRDHLLNIEFENIPEIEEAVLQPFICKMRKSKRNKKRVPENFQLCYSNVGLSLYSGKPLTHEEATREALAVDICKRFSILEKERPMIETMAYSDKYKKTLDRIVMDKLKLDGEIKKEEDKTIKQGITMLDHSKAEPMGVLKDVLCQVGVTTIITKFLILDMPIDRDAPILVGRGFLYTCGSILNTRDKITSTFDGVCRLTFRAAKTSLNTEESDSDEREDYCIQRNSFGAPMYGPKPAKYLICNDLMDRALAMQEVINPFRKIHA